MSELVGGYLGGCVSVGDVSLGGVVGRWLGKWVCIGRYVYTWFRRENIGRL